MTTDRSGIDALAALAVACHGGPGRLAVLLGSGVSYAAGIPTGWQVVTDLARKLAAAEGIDPLPDDPIGWFAERHGQEPGYSELVAAIAPSPDLRRDLLSGYFEPTAEERESGVKAPTRAHKAIARLAARGIIRVIITTNFDRLMEQALQAEGIEPVVVANADDAAGVAPVAHNRCTLIKVHGDYLNPDIRNTVDELDHYEPALDQLLDRILDEYGLIVCGWSATWDNALRNAIGRTLSRRYPLYWAAHGTMSTEAEKLATNRDAIVIPIAGADDFFDDLVTRIELLDDLAARAREGVEFVAAAAKRYLPDPTDRIRLHDLVHDKAAAALAAVADAGAWPAPTPDSLRKLVTEIEAASADLVAVLMVLGSFGDEERHTQLAARALTQAAGPASEGISGYTYHNALRLLPALLAMYAVGIGATSMSNWALLTEILANARVSDGQAIVPLHHAVRSWAVIDDQLGKALIPEQNYKLPGSEWLHTRMSQYASKALGLDGRAFDKAFDEWEYLVGVATHARKFGGGPVGRFVYTRRHRSADRWPARALDAVKPGILAGLFDDDAARFTEVFDSYHKMIAGSSLEW